MSVERFSTTSRASTVLRNRSGTAARRYAATWALVLLAGVSVRALGQEEKPEVARALELESAGKYREAVAAFKIAMKVAPGATALLGLERVSAELGQTDSLVAPLDTLIAAHPRESIYRTVQLRTYQILRRDDKLRESFEKWARAMPRDPSPYREYARILILQGRPATADSVIMRGKSALGSLRDLEYENAQLRAAMGEWIPSALSWRRALSDAPHLATAASFALARAPASARDGIRDALASLPAEPGPRRALADLELNWGQSQDAWDALRSLKPDTAAATMWEEFAERAYAEERWTIARDAYTAAYRVHPSVPLATRAASASLRAGSPEAVFVLVPLGGGEKDSSRSAREIMPLHVAALVALGRASDADALIARYDKFLVPVVRMRVAQMVATAWVRSGDLVRARQALATAGPEADSSEAAGWLALYDGRIGSARMLLRTARTPTPDLALAMGIIVRVKSDSAPQLGAAFLALARGDTVGASARFVEASAHHADVAPALLLIAARLRAARGDDAVPIWTRIMAEHPTSPEAVESELEWARLLRKRGDVAGATEHLEHLILNAPQSALLPQARRELELARGAIPPS
ncbi:MAG: hypothetical protein JWM95_4900 [Gemmatimonadetes bacterium]|nr:hypothetical protein [Gemmatimonadota bacterium]